MYYTSIISRNFYFTASISYYFILQLNYISEAIIVILLHYSRFIY